MKVTGLKDVEVMRALQWLQNKNVVKLKEEQKELVYLDENGQNYLKYGLPERRFLEATEKQVAISEIKKKTGLSDEEITISLGVLKSKAAINITKGKELEVSITEQGRNMLRRGLLEEQFLKEHFPKEAASLNEEEKFIFENLRKRKKIIKVERAKVISAELTKIGKILLKEKLEENLIERVTPSLIKTGSWKGKSRISKKGNSHIRSALYFPALNAVRRNNNFTTFYKRIKEKKGGKSLIACTALQRKLLILCFTLWRNDTVYTESYLSVA